MWPTYHILLQSFGDEVAVEICRIEASLIDLFFEIFKVSLCELQSPLSGRFAFIGLRTLVARDLRFRNIFLHIFIVASRYRFIVFLRFPT